MNHHSDSDGEGQAERSPKQLEYGEGVLTVVERNSLFQGKDREALCALSNIYGHSTDELINALHSIACRIAIACECDPDLFSQGLVHHWQEVIDFLDEQSGDRSQTSERTGVSMKQNESGSE